jgi:hypothetical protein
MVTNFRDLIDTPERHAQAQAWQKHLRERLGPAVIKRPAQLHYIYGVHREKMVLDQLALLRDSADTDERVIHLRNQWGEALALQGRFHEAAEVTTSILHRREYLAKGEAIAALGSDCECPVEKVVPSPTDAKGARQSNRVLVESIFDGEKFIALSLCLNCGGLRAKQE